MLLGEVRWGFDSVRRMADGMVDRLVERSAGEWAERGVEQKVERLVGRLVGRSDEWLVERLVEWLVEWLVERSVDELVGPWGEMMDDKMDSVKVAKMGLNLADLMGEETVVWTVVKTEFCLVEMLDD